MRDLIITISLIVGKDLILLVLDMVMGRPHAHECISIIIDVVSEPDIFHVGEALKVDVPEVHRLFVSLLTHLRCIY